MGLPGRDYKCPKRLGHVTQTSYVYVRDVGQQFKHAGEAAAEIFSDTEQTSTQIDATAQHRPPAAADVPDSMPDTEMVGLERAVARRLSRLVTHRETYPNAPRLCVRGVASREGPTGRRAGTLAREP